MAAEGSEEEEEEESGAGESAFAFFCLCLLGFGSCDPFEAGAAAADSGAACFGLYSTLGALGLASLGLISGEASTAEAAAGADSGAACFGLYSTLGALGLASGLWVWGAAFGFVFSFFSPLAALGLGLGDDEDDEDDEDEEDEEEDEEEEEDGVGSGAETGVNPASCGFGEERSKTIRDDQGRSETMIWIQHFVSFSLQTKICFWRRSLCSARPRTTPWRTLTRDSYSWRENWSSVESWARIDSL